MSVDPSTPPVPAPLPAAPTPSERPSRRSAVGLYVAMLVTLILLRGLTASPGDRVPVRNMDEQLMFAVGISSITGGPANTLGWPGGSMRLATTLLTPAVFAFEHHDAILHRRRDVPVEFVQFSAASCASRGGWSGCCDGRRSCCRASASRFFRSSCVD